MARKTGDGRTPAAEEEYYGDKVASAIDDMLPGAEISDEAEDGENLEDLDMGDETTEKPKKKVEEVKSAEEPQTPEPETEVEASIEPESESAVEETSEETSPADEVVQLRAQILAMQEMMSLGQNQFAPPQTQAAPQSQQPQQAPPVSQMRIGQLPDLSPPSEEELGEMITDPKKFHEYFINMSAAFMQQTMLNVTPMITQTVQTNDALKSFFSRPENKDVSDPVLRRYVIQKAGELEGMGDAGDILTTLDKAAGLARTALSITKAKPSNEAVKVGRTGLQAAQTTSRRFAGGTKTRTVPNEGEEEVNETEEQVEKMLNIGGTI